MKNYYIKYTVYSKSNQVIKSGKVKAKNKLSRFDAQCSFENHCIKKYKNFGRLVVHSCYEDGIFGDLENPFSEAFKGFKF